MLEWMVLPLKRYAEFSGRSRRMEYWSFLLFNMIVYAVLGGVIVAGAFAMAATAEANPGDPMTALMQSPSPLLLIGSGLMVLYMLAVLIPSLAVVVRRLHDRDMSGWWYLGVFVAAMIPVIGFIASIAFIVVMVLPGTSGPNRFGPDPKDPAGAEVFA